MATKYDDDGVEIHWDEREGYLSLACGVEAFERFRQVVREELKDVPEIPVDKVITIEISDTRKIVARRSRYELYAPIVLIALLAIAIPWMAGVVAIARWLR